MDEAETVTTAPGGDSESVSVDVAGMGGIGFGGSGALDSSGSASTHSSAMTGVGGLGRSECAGGGSERVLSLARLVAGSGGGACSAGVLGLGGAGLGAAGLGGAGLGAASLGAAGDAGAFDGPGATEGLCPVIGAVFGFAVAAGGGLATSGGLGLAFAGSGVTGSPPPIEIGALQLRHGTVPPRLRTTRTTSSPSTNVVEQALQCTCMARCEVYTERCRGALQPSTHPQDGCGTGRQLG
jgi:hypothetical protein